MEGERGIFLNGNSLDSSLDSRGLELRKDIGPEEHLLLLGRRANHIKRHRIAARHASPQVCTRVEPGRFTHATGLLLVLFSNLLELLADVGKGVEGDVVDVVFLAILLQPQATAGEEDVGFTGSRQVRDAVPNENDKRDGTILAVEFGLLAGFLNGLGFVVS